MKMKKVVFVEPSSTHLHVYSRLTIPRLGSVLLGSIMRDRGWDVKVYIEDIAPVDMTEVLSADIVGISALTSTAPPSYRLAATVREAGVPVVLGGSHTTFLPDEGLDHADYVVRGEGELAFPELVEAIERGRGFEGIQGLSYWRDGQKVHNPDRPRLEDLDANPIPDFSLVVGYGRRRIASVATSRGCPFPCTFCSVPGMYGSAFRTQSIDRVIAELQTHARSPYIFFADDNFTANRKRTKDLLARMIAEGITPEWGAQVRTETVDDDELLRLMHRSHCFNVFVGFESINPKTLHLFNKKQDLAKIQRAIDKFHDHGIKIHGMFVVGSDEDDVETIYQTARFARDNHIESIQLMILTPSPGSPDWSTLYSQGKKDILSNNWELFDGHHCVHQPRKIAPYELQMAAMKATEQFYSWGAILESLFRRDLFTAALRFSAKRLVKDWWKDPVNRAHTERLRQDLYAERQRAGRGAQGAVAVPEAFMRDQFGRLLERFLQELGVRVAPVTEPAAEALHRLQQTVDAIITPIVERTAKGKEELSQRLGAVTAAIHSNLDKWSRVIPLPVNFEQGPVFEPFARIGLLFTENLDRIRQAYSRAGEMLELWQDGPAAAQPVAVETSRR
ncbi:MAG TPA: radical SAM protein [Candidatus Methylomirabilis sp.]|nr:radical SAM protein [Candidatus Methylomirabilis sp.]